MAETRKTKAQLIKEIETLRATVAALEYAREGLPASEGSVHAFQERLVELHKATMELAQITDLSRLLRRAIELARERLGFDRIGLFMIDPNDPLIMKGTFGTDPQGRIRDERAVRLSMAKSMRVKAALEAKSHFEVWENVPIWDEERAAGQGWRIVATVWNGAENIGWLTADNLITQAALLPFQPELLALYGSTLGHLISSLQTQSALGESEARYHTLVETLPDAFVITDGRGNLVFASPRAGALYGTDDVDSMIGLSVLDLVVPSDRERVARNMALVIQNESVGSNEYTLIDAQGNPFICEIQSRALFDADNNPTAMISIARDVTERKRIEDALRQSEQEKTAVLDSMSELVIYLGTDLRIIWANRAVCEATGQPPEALIGRYCYSVWLQQSEPCAGCPVVAARDAGQPCQSEVRIIPNRVLLVSGYPVKSAQGVVEGIVEVTQDITGRLQAEQHRIELEVEKEQVNVLRRFLSHASHDLRIPLTTIKTRLYLLQNDSHPDKQKRHLEILDEEVTHLERLLEDMLSMTRLDKAPNYMFAPVAVNELIQSVVSKQEKIAARKNITIHFAGAPDLSPVQADRAYLGQAITKIVMNALHFTPQGGKVHVRTYQQAQHVVIEVQDDGIGISSDHVPHIFERFYRVDEARSQHSGGAGLGLAIAQKVIEGHQGTIEVNSELGKGSTFKILLPNNG